MDILDLLGSIKYVDLTAMGQYFAYWYPQVPIGSLYYLLY